MFKVGDKGFINPIGLAVVEQVVPNVEFGLVIKFLNSNSLMSLLHDGRQSYSSNTLKFQLIEDNLLAHPNIDNLETVLMNFNQIVDHLCGVDIQLAHDVLRDKYKLLRHQYATKLVGDYNQIKTEEKNEKL